MASAATPYGMRPIGIVGSAPYSGGTVRAFRITADNAAAIYTNGPVVMIAGAVNAMTTVPASQTLESGISTSATPLGIVTGVQYTDPTLKYSLWGQYLPANAVTAGYTNIMVFVNTDQSQLYMIQADGAVLQASIGLNMDINSGYTGVVASGLSNMTGKATTPAATASFPLKIVDLVNQSSIFGGGSSVPGDAKTDCIVQWNTGVLQMTLKTAQ